MKATFALLATIMLSPASSHAQSSRLFTLLVKSGEKVVQLLVEKKGDVAIGVVAGSVVTVGDKALSAYLAPKPPTLQNCFQLSEDVAACPTQRLPQWADQKPISDDDLSRAMNNLRIGMFQNRLDVQSGFGTQMALDPINNHVRLNFEDLAAWLAVQDSQQPKDFETYIHRFPAGEYRAEALKKWLTLSHRQ